MELKDVSKRYFISLIESIREELKIQITVENYKSATKTYADIKESLPKSSFGLSIKSEKHLKGSVLIDPMIVYTLSNKMLGGPGIVEIRPESFYTESEKVMGHIIREWAEEFFLSKNFQNVVVKSVFEGDPNSSLFEDDSLFVAAFVPIIKNKKMGKIYLCLSSEGA